MKTTEEKMADQKELERLRHQTKVEGLKRTLEALKADKWSDVAKLGKDAYVACVKEEASLGEQRKLQFAMLTAVGDQVGVRKFVDSQERIRNLLVGTQLKR